MTVPKVWNGTAWVDAQFHVGSNVWKKYNAGAFTPVMDVGFESGAEGYVTNTDGPQYGWSSAETGYMYSTNPLGFITSMNVTLPTGNTQYVTDLSLAQGHQVKCKSRVRFKHLAGAAFSAEVMSFDFQVCGASFSNSNEFINFPGVGWDSGWYWDERISTSTIDTAMYYSKPEFNLNVYTGPLSGDFQGWMGVSDVQFWDVQTGQLLMDRTTAPWIPKVYNGSAWV